MPSYGVFHLMSYQYPPFSLVTSISHLKIYLTLFSCALYFLNTDGHHKCIRWCFVTHGAIDGYSCLIVYLKCATNNKASTVYSEFMTAVQRFGLPSWIRTDCGTENLQVAQHMLRYRGLEQKSVLTGTSVHNRRIERLWRDLHQSAIKMYYRLFYHLENQHILDPLNELHLFALQVHGVSMVYALCTTHHPTNCIQLVFFVFNNQIYRHLISLTPLIVPMELMKKL